MANETDQTESEPSKVPPEAFERVKAERDALKAQTSQAAEALTQVKWERTLYDYFSGLDPSTRPADPMAAALNFAPSIPPDTEDIAAAIAAEEARLSSLRPQAKPTETLPPMAGGGVGPQPGAPGAELETGPFPIGSPEFEAFVAKEGMPAAHVAIKNGMFFPSDENLQAQSTIGL